MNTVYMFFRQKTGDYLAGCAGLKKLHMKKQRHTSPRVRRCDGLKIQVIFDVGRNTGPLTFYPAGSVPWCYSPVSQRENGAVILKIT
jgi:hypothetical protein